MKIAIVVALCLAACTPAINPGPDSGDASSMAPSPASSGSPACVAACADMAQFCTEGSNAYCAGDLTKVEQDRIIAIPWCDSGSSCFFTCDRCRQARTPAEVTGMCGTKCTPALAQGASKPATSGQQ